MMPEKKRMIAKTLSLAVTIGGMIVIAGWIFDIGVLKSISSAWVSMKLATAFTFVLSGITLYFIVRAGEGEFDKAQVVISLTSLTIMLLMGILLFSALLKIHTGVEDLFIKESVRTAKDVTPGRPSAPTILNFILIAVAGILTLLNRDALPSKLRIIGMIVGTIGAVALVGYSIDAPMLYYFIEGINGAIALHTAILFVLLGIGLLCL